LFAATLMLAGAWSVAFAQTCPTGCDLITSGTQTFCRCLIYTTPDASDRVQMVTDKSVTIVDVDGDGQRDIPFGIWYYGRVGTYILRQTTVGIPGAFEEVKISDTTTYGLTPVSDINGDGYMDFVITTHSYSTYLLESPGALAAYSVTSIFSDPAASPNSVAASGDHIFFSDYSGAVARYDISSASLYRRLDTEMYCGDGVAYADFDRDGYLDVACSNHDGGASSSFNGIVVYPFNGIDFLTPEIITTDPYQGIIAYDFDRDSNPDIVAAGARLSIFYNEGTGWTEVVLDSDFSAYGAGWNRVNIMDVDCDGDMDVVASTACPTSDGVILAWYEHLDTTARTWARHPIEDSGNNCSGSAPYPYGVRVGLLDEYDSPQGRGDIVIVRNASNQIWAYYNVTPGTPLCELGQDDELDISERYSFAPDGPISLYTKDGRLLYRGAREGIPELSDGIYFIVTDRKVERLVVR